MIQLLYSADSSGVPMGLQAFCGFPSGLQWILPWQQWLKLVNSTGSVRRTKALA